MDDLATVLEVLNRLMDDYDFQEASVYIDDNKCLRIASGGDIDYVVDINDGVEVWKEFSVSERTLKMMDKSVDNIKNGNVSGPIDISKLTK